MATSHDALCHLEDVCRRVTQERDHWLGDAVESAAALGAGETLYAEITELMQQPENHLPPAVARAWQEAQAARRVVS